MQGCSACKWQSLNSSHLQAHTLYETCVTSDVRHVAVLLMYTQAGPDQRDSARQILDVLQCQYYLQSSEV